MDAPEDRRRPAKSSVAAPPGPPSTANSGSGFGTAATAGMTATLSGIWRPAGFERSSGTRSVPQTADVPPAVHGVINSPASVMGSRVAAGDGARDGDGAGEVGATAAGPAQADSSRTRVAREPVSLRSTWQPPRGVRRSSARSWGGHRARDGRVDAPLRYSRSRHDAPGPQCRMGSTARAVRPFRAVTHPGVHGLGGRSRTGACPGTSTPQVVTVGTGARARHPSALPRAVLWLPRRQVTGPSPRPWR